MVLQVESNAVESYVNILHDTPSGLPSRFFSDLSAAPDDPMSRVFGRADVDILPFGKVPGRRRVEPP